MGRTPSNKPTEAELAILQVLWLKGPCTVREIFEALYQPDETSYTTALKLLQIMHGKGLVERDESQRAHSYRAAVSQSSTQKRFLSDVVDRVFNGSSSQLVLQALGSAPPASAEELAQIRALLDQLDNDKKN
ncbi:MAG: BlaI/MecI/CopY family transcriptional regulator [Xanthomonadales bacterium]|nr:BlaI/MecI/CopY family transcriptional regulator [Xanthomonadales bacterium]